MSNDARSQIKLFSMVAAILMVAATEIIVAYHYFNTLQGFGRIALVGLAVVAWVILWATWWASKAGEDAKVKYTAYIVAFAVSGVMIFNGAMVIADLTLDKRAEKADKSEVAKIEARGRAAAELKKSGGTWRELRELNRSQTSETATIRPDAPTESDVDRYKWVKDYISFEIFFVPFLAALLGKFLLVAIIALPGGASGYLPTSSSRPSTEPMRPIPNPFRAEYGTKAPWPPRSTGDTGLGVPANQSDEPSATRGNGGGIGFTSSTLGGGSARGQWGGGAFGGDSREGSVPKGIRPR